MKMNGGLLLKELAPLCAVTTPCDNSIVPVVLAGRDCGHPASEGNGPKRRSVFAFLLFTRAPVSSSFNVQLMGTELPCTNWVFAGKDKSDKETAGGAFV